MHPAPRLVEAEPGRATTPVSLSTTSRLTTASLGTMPAGPTETAAGGAIAAAPRARKNSCCVARAGPARAARPSSATSTPGGRPARAASCVLGGTRFVDESMRTRPRAPATTTRVHV